LLWGALHAFTQGWVPLSISRALACLATVVFILMINRKRKCEDKEKSEAIISAYLMSFGASYVLHYFSVAIIGIIPAIIQGNEVAVDTALDFNHPLYVLMYGLIAILQIGLAYLLFRIKRFKNGFRFIFNKFTIVAALFVTGAILIFVTWVNALSTAADYIQVRHFSYIGGVLIAGVGIFILIKRLIKMVQLKRMQEHRENYLERELDVKNNEISDLKKENLAYHGIVHRFTERLESMETAVRAGNVALDDILGLQEEFRLELAKINNKPTLPKTKVQTIDNLFEHFAKKFASDNIIFTLIISGSIIYMVENVVEKGKLETLIADHIKDAHIAINARGGPFRSILAALELSDNCYQFSVHDTGVSFEVDTLERLGADYVTTHAGTGGSGTGFMTTFETMRKYGASLIIDEQEESENDFSKSVTIRFDGQNQYIIKTHRPEDFAKSDRYIIENNHK